MRYTDLQKQTTRKHIEKALFECLEEESWKMLRISHLCEQAQISRRTFYRHYASLQACLDAWFDRLAGEYLQQTRPLDSYDLKRITDEFFAFWNPYRDQLRILEQAGADLQTPFFSTARTIIIARGGGENRNLLLFSSGGFYTLWKHWIEQTD